MTRILLVGTGLTSAITAAILRQHLPKAELILWDKAKGVGGRMSTFRNNIDDSSFLDLGAQYISSTPDYAQRHKMYYEELLKAGILTPLVVKMNGMKKSVEGTQHYVTPHGVSSIVKHFLKKANSRVEFSHCITSIDKVVSGWEVTTNNGEKGNFDVVVLTMPVPQILQLQGRIQHLIAKNDALRRQLNSVEYSSRYALGLFFSQGSDIRLSDPASSAQYVSDDPIVRFVALDNVKRGQEDGCPAVVVHTSIPFGKAHVDKTPDEVRPTLVRKVQEMFPDWPEAKIIKCQKWRYSQVTSAFPGLPGAVSIEAGLIAGGDGFTHSNMDGCIESALAVADAVLQLSWDTEET